MTDNLFYNGKNDMKISIKYCAEWNYKPRASSMGDALNKEFMADIELIAGGGGIFDISLDGKKIFSKFDTGSFPQPAEIIELIKKG